MERSGSAAAAPNPIAAVSSFLHHHVSCLGAELSARIDDGMRLLAGGAAAARPRRLPPFAAASLASRIPPAATHVFDVALSTDEVARTLAGTAVYTVSNSNNEFVLISDPNNGLKSLGILCFRHEDAHALLAQVQLRQPILGKWARVVPITLDQSQYTKRLFGYKTAMQCIGRHCVTTSNCWGYCSNETGSILEVYMLKVEGIAFRFLPDPLQIKNALELKATDRSGGFDGVPVFQSDLLVVKKRNRRYCPIYFQKEDIERELLKVSKPRGPGYSQQIMVGSLEDVLRKMEMNDKKSGWDDLIFIPPGKSYTQHINEVAA